MEKDSDWTIEEGHDPLVWDLIVKRIRDCCREVFNELGSGHTEAVYESALEVELLNIGVQNIRRQVPCPIYYKGFSVGTGYIDILVDTFLVIELKSLHKTTYKDEAQLRKYLSPGQKGLLINFNLSTGGVEITEVEP